jgi:hypothetical protein
VKKAVAEKGKLSDRNIFTLFSVCTNRLIGEHTYIGTVNFYWENVTLNAQIRK